MSLPRKQSLKIKKLCKQHGIDVQILNNDLNEYSCFLSKFYSSKKKKQRKIFFY